MTPPSPPTTKKPTQKPPVTTTRPLIPVPRCPPSTPSGDKLDAIKAQLDKIPIRKCPGECLKLKVMIAEIIVAALKAVPTPPVDLSGIEAELAAIKAKLATIQPTPTDLSGIETKLAELEGALTAIASRIDNVGATQDRVADAIGAMAQAQVGTNAKLDAAIKLLKEGGGQPVNVTLTVQSSPNLPASYVDTSTIWAIQRRTGLSHVILVINSDDPEWARLQPEYVKARYKFPAMQLVDVKSDRLKMSPTPQLVLYYVDEGRQPEVISGDRIVGAKLRELYSN